MKSKTAMKRIIDTLKELYPDALCSLQYQKDYELLFAVRLSAQCTDERVNKVTPALFRRFPTLESFAEADPAEVGTYIHSCGFFNGKSRDLVACAQMLLEKHGGKVHGTMEELVRILRTKDTLPKSMSAYNRILRCNLLCIDEITLMPLKREEAVAFFNLINALHEKTSVIITTNKAPTEWVGIFGDEALTSAILDRLLFHCDVIKLDGSSYRMDNRSGFLKDK